jgi:outer membrane immunogenic protein
MQEAARAIRHRRAGNVLLDRRRETAMRMIASIVASAFTTILAGSVHAADLPYKAPPPQLPVFSWTGFYAGLNAGGGIGVSSTAQSTTFTSTALGTNGLLASGASSLAMTGWVLGGQAGFNWQVAPSIVLGIEGDWQWTSQRGSTVNSTPAATSVGFFGAGANGFGYDLATQHKLTQIATARARGGVVVQNALWYVTGGAAWGTIKDSYAFTGTANPLIFPPALQPGPFLNSAAGFSASKWGWTLGAGVETRLGGGWSAKLEYLYVDLGYITDRFPIAINPAFGPAFSNGGSANATSTYHVTDNIIRAGVNYRFFNY